MLPDRSQLRAAYTAAIALDPKTAGRDVHVVGQQLSLLDLHKEVEAAAGRPWRLVHKGSPADLQAEIIRRQFAAAGPLEYVALQYQTVMYTGQASVTDIRNADYPAIVPTSVAAYLAGPGAAHLTAANPRLS